LEVGALIFIEFYLPLLESNSKTAVFPSSYFLVVSLQDAAKGFPISRFFANPKQCAAPSGWRVATASTLSAYTRGLRTARRPRAGKGWLKSRKGKYT